MNTHKEQDWQVAAFVHGFPSSGDGVSKSKKFEADWQHYPCPECRPLHQTVHIARYLVAQAELAVPPQTLFIESEV